jgi:hypothetical protein
MNVTATHLRRLAQLGFVVVVIAGAALLNGSCGPEPEEQPPEVTAAAPVENQNLKLRLAALPGDFVLETNEGDQLVLAPADPAQTGRVEFAVRSPEQGQNIPSAVKFHQAFIENQEGGDYQGGQELVSPLGTTFYSRGRYLADEVETEETVIFALHPDADRMMTITYRYPAGVDSSVRVQQLFDVLAEVEGL